MLWDLLGLHIGGTPLCKDNVENMKIWEKGNEIFSGIFLTGGRILGHHSSLGLHNPG